MVSAETLLDYPYQTIPLTVHTYAYDKQLGDVISQSNKHIAFIQRYLANYDRDGTSLNN